MRKLTESEIKKYVDIDKSWGCAGSYKYESMAQHLFEKVEGDYFSVLGIAIQPLLNFLYKNKIIKF
jgi:septum formation protein